MLLVTSLLRWWYTDGWRQRVQMISNRIDGTMDYFSFDLLLKTLFQPFRQISSGSVDGPLEVKMRALVDKLVSRVIGAMIRLIILIVGGFVMAFQALLAIVVLVGWAFVPLLPVVGFVMMMLGRTF